MKVVDSYVIDVVFSLHLLDFIFIIICQRVELIYEFRKVLNRN